MALSMTTQEKGDPGTEAGVTLGVDWMLRAYGPQHDECNYFFFLGVSSSSA